MSEKDNTEKITHSENGPIQIAFCDVRHIIGGRRKVPEIHSVVPSENKFARFASSSELAFFISFAPTIIPG
ncbi:TPA: hypothetical protein U0S14_004693 [Escherichia coli]|nr:hypothetical protein [Escherichia coli]